jgi:hypothetical protein
MLTQDCRGVRIVNGIVSRQIAILQVRQLSRGGVFLPDSLKTLVADTRLIVAAPAECRHCVCQHEKKQNDGKPQNLVALWEALQEYGTY